MFLILLIIGFILICIFFITGISRLITKKENKETKINEETKKIRSWIKILFIILVIVVILLFIIFKQTDTETERDYTGYQLTLTAEYGGYSIAGEDLGSGTKKKIYNILKNDILYEPYEGGLWLLNADAKKSWGIILEIIELDEDTVTIKNNDNTYNIEYNQEFNISSNGYIADGINYSYIIEIIKE